MEEEVSDASEMRCGNASRPPSSSSFMRQCQGSVKVRAFHLKLLNDVGVFIWVVDAGFFLSISHIKL